MPAGSTEIFEQHETGAVDLALEAEWTRNDFSLGYLFYHRTLTDAIAFSFDIIDANGLVIVVRAEPIWIGNDWFFAGPLPMRKEDKFKFTTTGAIAGEDHTARILLKVGLH